MNLQDPKVPKILSILFNLHHMNRMNVGYPLIIMEAYR